jgi:tricorn protease
LPDGFYRYPTIGGGTIVFAAEGDLWKVPVAGGVALRLTAFEGEEAFPKLSPDGRMVAFTAQYEGNDDVYVMTASGGEPVRLTYHPAPDQTLGWSPDGKILFRSRRDTPHNDFRIYKIAPEGGVPEMIRLEPAAWIGIEPNGKRVAFQKLGLEFHNWKRYKGGQAKEFTSALSTTVPLPKSPTTMAKTPSQCGRGWAGSISSQIAGAGQSRLDETRWQRREATHHLRGLRRALAGDGDGKIVYQHKMDVWLYDLASGDNQLVPIQLPSDRLQVRERLSIPRPSSRPGLCQKTVSASCWRHAATFS